MFKNSYIVLGLNGSGVNDNNSPYTQAEIYSAYQECIKKTHSLLTNADTAKEFSELNRAYDTLSKILESASPDENRQSRTEIARVVNEILNEKQPNLTYLSEHFDLFWEVLGAGQLGWADLTKFDKGFLMKAFKHPSFKKIGGLSKIFEALEEDSLTIAQLDAIISYGDRVNLLSSHLRTQFPLETETTHKIAELAKLKHIDNFKLLKKVIADKHIPYQAYPLIEQGKLFRRFFSEKAPMPNATYFNIYKQILAEKMPMELKLKMLQDAETFFDSPYYQCIEEKVLTPFSNEIAELKIIEKGRSPAKLKKVAREIEKIDEQLYNFNPRKDNLQELLDKKFALTDKRTALEEMSYLSDKDTALYALITSAIKEDTSDKPLEQRIHQNLEKFLNSCINDKILFPDSFRSTCKRLLGVLIAASLLFIPLASQRYRNYFFSKPNQGMVKLCQELPNYQPAMPKVV